jgi:bacterioferritin
MVANSIIRDLNDILKKQLTAINQFFVHSKIQKKNGLLSIAMQYAKLGINGGKTAEKLIEILVDLDELPQIKDYDLLKSHRDIQKQLSFDTALILSMIDSIHKCLKKCKESEELALTTSLSEILLDIEKQSDFLESQLSIIDSIGLNLYTEGLKKPFAISHSK